ncbi:MAG: macro domain-containing protein, partial [Candidatus Acidiferrales bacterium]
DPATCKVSTDVTMMWLALHHLWQRVRIESGGYPVNLPLVGSGLSGIGLPTRDLLNLIILSAITETKAKEVTQRIRIVLHRDQFEKLDLRDVRQYWKEV